MKLVIVKPNYVFQVFQDIDMPANLPENPALFLTLKYYFTLLT